jgi:hypothetical protein
MKDRSTIENFDDANGFFERRDLGEEELLTTKDTKIHEGKPWA